MPVPSHRLDRWLSAEDEARHEAEARLARSAGTLVAAGLPVSGSVGDADPAQAVEDELRDFAADEVVLVELDCQIRCLAFSPDGKFLYTANGNTTCYQFEVAKLLGS